MDAGDSCAETAEHREGIHGVGTVDNDTTTGGTAESGLATCGRKKAGKGRGMRGMGMSMGLIDDEIDNSKQQCEAHALPAPPLGWRPAEPSPCASKPFAAAVLVTDGPTVRESSPRIIINRRPGHPRGKGDHMVATAHLVRDRRAIMLLLIVSVRNFSPLPTPNLPRSLQITTSTPRMGYPPCGVSLRRTSRPR